MKSQLHVLPSRSNDYVKKINLYKDIDRQIKALELERESLKKEFANTIFANSDEYIFNGRLLATYKSQSRQDIDRKLFKETMPELYDQFTVSITYPVLRIK